MFTSPELNATVTCFATAATDASLDSELLCVLKAHVREILVFIHISFNQEPSDILFTLFIFVVVSVFNKRRPEDCSHSLRDPPPYCISAAGLLRHHRESDNHEMNLTAILPLVLRSNYCC